MIQKYRALFVSDVHLLSKDSEADLFLHFLDTYESEYLYLVGDIFDFWHLKKQLYWPQSYGKIIRKIFKKSSNGCKVFYIPGNHDELFKKADGFNLGNINITEKCEYVSLTNKKFLVIHGDIFDPIIACNWLVVNLGSIAYKYLLYLNRSYNFIRSILGLKKRSLSALIKNKIKRALEYINRFEHVATMHAKKMGYDGIICGHIHRPLINESNGIIYINTGDFIENCTAICENQDGEISILYFNDISLQKDSQTNKLAISNV